MATDAWLGGAILGIDQPFHPSQPNAEYETDGNDMSIFATVTPSYAEVLQFGPAASRWCATSSPQ
jgi:hypothetical protein